MNRRSSVNSSELEEIKYIYSEIINFIYEIKYKEELKKLKSKLKSSVKEEKNKELYLITTKDELTSVIEEDKASLISRCNFKVDEYFTRKSSTSDILPYLESLTKLVNCKRDTEKKFGDLDILNDKLEDKRKEFSQIEALENKRRIAHKVNSDKVKMASKQADDKLEEAVKLKIIAESKELSVCVKLEALATKEKELKDLETKLINNQKYLEAREQNLERKNKAFSDRLLRANNILENNDKEKARLNKLEMQLRKELASVIEARNKYVDESNNSNKRRVSRV